MSEKIKPLAALLCVLGVVLCWPNSYAAGSDFTYYKHLMRTNGWECRVTVRDLNCIVRLPVGYKPLHNYQKKTVLALDDFSFIVTYDIRPLKYEFSLQVFGKVLEPKLLSILGDGVKKQYEYNSQDDGVWVPVQVDSYQAGFRKFLMDMAITARKAGISEKTLRVLDNTKMYNKYRKPMFLPEGMVVTEFLRALPTETKFLQYLYYIGIGPMVTDKERIESMPLMLMFLVDTARLSSVGMIASAQCTVRGEPTTVCNYYVLGAGGFKLTDKAGFQMAIDSYKEKRI
ncbi:MAG: hypothetical protein ACYSUC_08560 [Planctomycetota bacterium]